ncbi:MAG TPA: VWA domain-containing protein [Bryobacteraceae bacterium]|jgi:VWFA-related protein|nr:VWA domain-containing protein [Bryobacteraceae bacterium]
MRKALAPLLAIPLLLAQQQPPAGVPSIKFTADSQLVVETVSVKDKNGNPIEGLTAKDFVVTENGVPQEIKFCEFQRIDNTPAGPVQAPTIADVAKAAAPPNVTAVQITPEAPGDIKYRDRRLLAIYFDMSAMPIPDQLRALDAAQKFIKTKMAKADLMALMKYDAGAVKVLQDFTDDRDQLLKVIGDLIVGEAQGLDENAADASAADTGAAFGQDDSEFNLFNTDRQLAALQTAIRMLGNLNEKKALVYFASGMRLNGVDNQAQMRATVNSAIRANVSLWPVDARGLVALPPLGDATRGSPGGQAMYTGGSAGAMMSGFQASQDTLYALAADTGGKALLDNNELSTGIVNAEQAISNYYIIGYYTTNAALDGKFRKINISLKEIAAKLDYRQGYFAGKTFNKFTVADKERQLEDALMLGDPITDLTIQMEVNYFQLNRAEYYVPVVMKIPGSELALARRGGAEHTVIDFIGEIKDEYGATVANLRDKVDIKLSGETAQQLARRPIEYDTGYTLLPGTYNIKVLARDDETGRIGTYMSKFVIPNLNKEDKRIPISSVVLSSQRVDLREALYTAGKDKEQVANPLVQEGQKLIPSVTRVFSRSRDMYVYLQAYEPTAQAPEPLVAFVTFYRGQTKAFETAPLPVTDAMNNRLKTVPLRFSLALEKLPPGRYNCQVTVLDPAAQKAAFWQAPVMLVP